MQELSKHVGNRIRIFRKVRGLSVEQLGERIGRSKATVYKYESGQISVDVEAIAEICKVLRVEPVFLFDMPKSKELIAHNIAFFDTGVLYTYYYDGRIKQISRSLLTFRSDPVKNVILASLYMHLSDFAEPERSRYIYSGTLSSHEVVSYFILENITLPIETLVIEMIHPFQTSQTSWGLFMGLSDQPMAPMCTKMLFSKVPLSKRELEDYHLSFTKDELKNIKEKNSLLLSIRVE
ncbi:MAG: helix-turn-helix transcriptional regulator [Angelakisella sp.]|nr:helix-turn-helix transcriptional regulator [Angelakisella sp.]